MVDLETKNVVFISHASEDEAAANALYKLLCLGKSSFCEGVDIRCTSAKTQGASNFIVSGPTIWQAIREELEKTICFVALLSEAFFKSNWCIAEYAIFQELLRDSSDRCLSLFAVYPNDISMDSSIFMEAPYIFKLWDLNEVNKFVDQLVKKKVLKINFLNEGHKNIFCEEVKNIACLRIQEKKGGLTEIAKQHFGNGLTSNGPLTCLVGRDEYEQISVNIACQAKSKLLWTLFKSPLLVADAYRNSNKLMDYDLSFQNFRPKEKIRLVIFEDLEMAKAYKDCDEHYHNERFKELHIKSFDNLVDFKISVTQEDLRERKDAFENSVINHGGELYFTTLGHLHKLFAEVVNAPSFDENSYLEFSYIDYQPTLGKELILESGFTSEFFRINKNPRISTSKGPLQFRHVTFFVEPGSDCNTSIGAMTAYKNFYGHLDHLRIIGKTLFLEANRKRSVFIHLSELDQLT